MKGPPTNENTPQAERQYTARSIARTESKTKAADRTCTPKTYTVGQSFTDIGCGDIHNIVNNTAAEAKTVVVQIVPAGQPRRIDEPAPGNCPALTCP